jgi:predicted acylesterase/phospholipase RssA
VLLAAAEIRGRSTGVDVANVGIVPSVSEFSSFDFDAVPEIYQRGREAATEALPEIRSAIEQGHPPARTTWD